MKKVVDCVKACDGVSRLQRASGLSINAPAPSTQRKPNRRDLRLELRQRMHGIAQTRIRYGYRRS